MVAVRFYQQQALNKNCSEHLVNTMASKQDKAKIGATGGIGAALKKKDKPKGSPDDLIVG